MPYGAPADTGAGTNTAAAGTATSMPCDAPASIGADTDTAAAGTVVSMHMMHLQILVLAQKLLLLAK